MRVLVVDDTAVFRRAVSDALAGLPGVEVVGTAKVTTPRGVGSVTLMAR